MNFIRLLLPLLLVILAGCAEIESRKNAEKTHNYTTTSQGQVIARDTSRTVDLTEAPANVWDRIRRGFAIPNLNTDLSTQWTEYYASHPDSFKRMAERASIYLYFVVDEVNRRGLPTELALLPFIESAYNPTALSSAKASGLWQFIPTTGKHYKLKQDWWRDERRDLIASTNAALDYLENLFEMQGDWYLALASYNWGEGSVQRAIAKNDAAGQPTDYLSLSMPDETRNYVPKLQAIKNIISDPKRYALSLPPIDNAPYFVTVQKSSDIDVALAAKLAEMPLADFKALNPSFNRPVIRGDNSPTLLLPADRVHIFNTNLLKHKGDLSAWKVYHTRRGESYATIAKRFGLSESLLRQTNDISSRHKIAAGQSLLVPGSPGPNGIRLASASTPDEALGDAPPPRLGPPSHSRAKTAFRTATETGTRHVHTVRSGETLSSIAQKYRTTAGELRTLNSLPSNRTLKVGQTLRVSQKNVTRKPTAQKAVSGKNTPKKQVTTKKPQR